MPIMKPYFPILCFSLFTLPVVVACSSTISNVGSLDDASVDGAATTTTTGDAGSNSKDASALPDLAPGTKRVFVTAQRFSGSLASGGNLAGADAACIGAAQTAGMGGNWKAWLSSSTVDAIDRVSDVGPWYDLGGTLIFSNKANLATVPLAGLWKDETGASLGSDRIWTGTAVGGQYIEDLGPGSKPCGDWMDASISSTAKIGQIGRRDSAWTAFAGTTCDQQAHLICFEQ